MGLTSKSPLECSYEVYRALLVYLRYFDYPFTEPVNPDQNLEDQVLPRRIAKWFNFNTDIIHVRQDLPEKISDDVYFDLPNIMLLFDEARRWRDLFDIDKETAINLATEVRDYYHGLQIKRYDSRRKKRRRARNVYASIESCNLEDHPNPGPPSSKRTLPWAPSPEIRTPFLGVYTKSSPNQGQRPQSSPSLVRHAQNPKKRESPRPVSASTDPSISESSSSGSASSNSSMKAHLSSIPRSGGSNTSTCLPSGSASIASILSNSSRPTSDSKVSTNRNRSSEPSNTDLTYYPGSDSKIRRPVGKKSVSGSGSRPSSLISVSDGLSRPTNPDRVFTSSSSLSSQVDANSSTTGKQPTPAQKLRRTTGNIPRRKLGQNLSRSSSVSPQIEQKSSTYHPKIPTWLRKPKGSPEILATPPNTLRHKNNPLHATDPSLVQQPDLRKQFQLSHQLDQVHAPEIKPRASDENQMSRRQELRKDMLKAAHYFRPKLRYDLKLKKAKLLKLIGKEIGSPEPPTPPKNSQPNAFWRYMVGKNGNSENIVQRDNQNRKTYHESKPTIVVGRQRVETETSNLGGWKKSVQQTDRGCDSSHALFPGKVYSLAPKSKSEEIRNDTATYAKPLEIHGMENPGGGNVNEKLTSIRAATTGLSQNVEKWGKICVDVRAQAENSIQKLEDELLVLQSKVQIERWNANGRPTSKVDSSEELKRTVKKLADLKKLMSEIERDNPWLPQRHQSSGHENVNSRSSLSSASWKARRPGRSRKNPPRLLERGKKIQTRYSPDGKRETGKNHRIRQSLEYLNPFRRIKEKVNPVTMTPQTPKGGVSKRRADKRQATGFGNRY